MTVWAVLPRETATCKGVWHFFFLNPLKLDCAKAHERMCFSKRAFVFERMDWMNIQGNGSQGDCSPDKRVCVLIHLICCKILRCEPFSPLNYPRSTVLWEGKNNKTWGQLMKTQGWEGGQGTKVPTGSTEKKVRFRSETLTPQTQGLDYSLGTWEPWEHSPFHQAAFELTSHSSSKSVLTTQPSRRNSGYHPFHWCLYPLEGLLDEKWKWCSHRAGGHRSSFQSQEKYSVVQQEWLL